jgi:Family of unknown function (DUF5681)
MTKPRTAWKKGQSGNPRGRPVGTGRIEEYRAILEPDVPGLLKILVQKAQQGDLWAIRMILERVYPVRDAAVADLMADILELRELIETKKPAPDDAEMAGLLQEIETLRKQVQKEATQ